ncbi:OmpA family protein [Mucilaginibacter corticis]|uniref:OmpA family protein n=1 Tax=Mucilaginibacter corticis TaxID=2597670 RepID=A0A556MBE6_9SPHI|nr:OmpA family protein [Mucilaginibacter corticis]TSJ37257.1 OmpA family protein [Mucilaginibacter corticis]
MKTNLKKTALILTGVLVGGATFAQTTDSIKTEYVQPFSPVSSFRTWSIGINGGLLTPYSPFRSGREDFVHAGTDIGYSAYIKDQILPSFGLQLSYLGGKISGNQSQDNSLTSYSTKLKYAVDLSANFTLANISWRNNKNAIQPYLTAGFGMMGYTPTTVFANGQPKDFGHVVKNGYVPVGAGFKINLSQGVNLDLGYQIAFVDGDNLDGFNFGSNNDKFSYGHIGLEFALGGSSKPQLATHNPVSSMRHEYLLDEQRLQTQVDAQKAANNQLRSDLDATKNALNTTNANLAKFTTDSDGDGVPDFYDKCPGTPAGTKVDGSGCPLPVATTKIYVTEEDKKVVKEAIKNLEFDFGKATIRDHSLPSLDKVAQLLIDKNFSLKLAGHTDNVGSDAANLKLSKDRAESIKTYLVSKGANASRIEATGYGKTQPIASNKTAKGRQLNRRVEFTLF